MFIQLEQSHDKMQTRSQKTFCRKLSVYDRESEQSKNSRGNNSISCHNKTCSSIKVDNVT